MTLAEAKQIVKSLGLVLVKREGEYIVKFPGVAIDDSRTYFTGDIDDAVSTARAMSPGLFRGAIWDTPQS